MNWRRVILAAIGVFVAFGIVLWVFDQPPEELSAWLSDLRPQIQSSVPPRVPPPPPPKRVGPCVGLTWTLISQEKLLARVGPAAQLQAPCDTELSVLCFNGKDLGVTVPMSGQKLSQRVIADAACMSRLGAGWRMLSVRDGARGVTANGELPTNVRFWAAGEYPANPWD